MKKHVSITQPLALTLFLPLLAIGEASTDAAQQSDPPAPEIEEAMREKLVGGGTFAEKIARAQGKSERVQNMAHVSRANSPLTLHCATIACCCGNLIMTLKCCEWERSPSKVKVAILGYRPDFGWIRRRF